jgi:hypothetical protein
MGDVGLRLGIVINVALQPKFRKPQSKFLIDSVFAFRSYGILSGNWTMGLDHIRAEIVRMRVQIKRQQRDILDLQKAGINIASAAALLERMYAKVDELIGERNKALAIAPSWAHFPNITARPLASIGDEIAYCAPAFLSWKGACDDFALAIW